MGIEQRQLGRVLVTGANGFLGAALLAELGKRKVDCIATDVAGSAPLPSGMQVLDVRDGPGVRAIMERTRFDTVFHCGAVSGPMVMADRPLDIWNINATGTANLLEAARLTETGRVVVCSTVEVYGEAVTGVATETTRPQPDGVYGASKLAAEQAALAYHGEHGLDTVALRFSWIYGPGRKTPTTLAALLADSLRGTPTRVEGHPADMTHYLFIEDAVEGLLRAATVAALRGERVFNITAGAGTPLSEILDQVRAVAPGVRIDFHTLSAAGSGPSGFSQDRAEAVLGYRAVTAFETGLVRTLATLRGAA
ncbi:NAD-dependent epimerase/dehydratase family protein [Dongia sedimenti]|uniref:NAD(P)-dependent oxidoreductase n=1 Tax=Dongia sedimenti TaxID=3064282 RepID=A0ABU0YRI8_9PROT|nr:NAD(P)-dependent oxidoreductase [Rhodospirillaceae bacterium R-7]